MEWPDMFQIVMSSFLGESIEITKLRYEWPLFGPRVEPPAHKTEVGHVGDESCWPVNVIFENVRWIVCSFC